MNSNCMHCKTALSAEFVTENVKRTSAYIAHRADLLFAHMQAQMPHLQASVRKYTEAKISIKALHVLRCENLELIRKMFEMYYKRKQRTNLEDNLRNLEVLKYTYDIENKRLAQIIDKNGVGLDDEAEVQSVNFIKACPAEGCRGFLSEDFKCALCSLEICKDCHEQLKAGHACDQQIIASVKALTAESKPCPNCSAAISKVDGCDQMWCTQCHTTFSWRTGQKEEGTTHNPHYYEWMRRSGIPIPRANAGCAPTRFPNYQAIYRRFSETTRKDCDVLKKGLTLYKDFHAKYPKHASLLAGHIRPPSLETFLEPLPSLAYYYLALTNMWSLFNKKRYDANHLRPTDLTLDFRRMCVKYMANELKAEEFKLSMEAKEFEHMSNQTLYSIHLMTFTAASDVLSEFLLSNHQLTTCHDTYTQLGRLLAYTNECLDKHSALFGVQQPKYEQNVFKM